MSKEKKQYIVLGIGVVFLIVIVLKNFIL